MKLDSFRNASWVLDCPLILHVVVKLTRISSTLIRIFWMNRRNTIFQGIPILVAFPWTNIFSAHVDYNTELWFHWASQGTACRERPQFQCPSISGCLICQVLVHGEQTAMGRSRAHSSHATKTETRTWNSYAEESRNPQPDFRGERVAKVSIFYLYSLRCGQTFFDLQAIGTLASTPPTPDSVCLGYWYLRITPIRYSIHETSETSLDFDMHRYSASKGCNWRRMASCTVAFEGMFGSVEEGADKTTFQQCG